MTSLPCESGSEGRLGIAEHNPPSRDFHRRPGSLHKPEGTLPTHNLAGAGMRGSTEPGGLVLIVEDNRNTSEMVGEYMAGRGLELTYASVVLDGNLPAAANPSHTHQ